jgi:hypothetical protein
MEESARIQIQDLSGMQKDRKLSTEEFLAAALARAKQACERAEKAEKALHQARSEWHEEKKRALESESELTTLRQQLKDSKQESDLSELRMYGPKVRAEIRALKEQNVPTSKETKQP